MKLCTGKLSKITLKSEFESFKKKLEIGKPFVRDIKKGALFRDVANRLNNPHKGPWFSQPSLRSAKKNRDV